MRKTEVTVLVQLRLLPDCIEQGKRDLLDFCRAVRKLEPECLAIEIAHDLDDPTSITMIEKWSDRKTYEGPHLQTDHMNAFIERASKYFDGPASISFCQGTVIEQDQLRRMAPYGR
jgi:quinol monooxygenase YgiN